DGRQRERAVARRDEQEPAFSHARAAEREAYGAAVEERRTDQRSDEPRGVHGRERCEEIIRPRVAEPMRPREVAERLHQAGATVVASEGLEREREVTVDARVELALAR